jgi:hypothetical protein
MDSALNITGTELSSSLHNSSSSNAIIARGLDIWQLNAKINHDVESVAVKATLLKNVRKMKYTMPCVKDNMNLGI